MPHAFGLTSEATSKVHVCKLPSALIDVNTHTNCDKHAREHTLMHARVQPVRANTHTHTHTHMHACTAPHTCTQVRTLSFLCFSLSIYIYISLSLCQISWHAGFVHARDVQERCAEKEGLLQHVPHTSAVLKA